MVNLNLGFVLQKETLSNHRSSNLIKFHLVSFETDADFERFKLDRKWKKYFHLKKQVNFDSFHFNSATRF